MTSLLSIMPAEGARSTPATRTRFTKHSNKVAKHHELLHAKNYSFVPVVTDTSGALHSASLRLLYDFPCLKTDAAEQRAVANSLRSPLTPEQLCQRRGAMVCSALDGSSAVQPLGFGLLGSAGLRPMPPHC